MSLAIAFLDLLPLPLLNMSWNVNADQHVTTYHYQYGSYHLLIRLSFTRPISFLDLVAKWFTTNLSMPSGKQMRSWPPRASYHK